MQHTQVAIRQEIQLAGTGSVWAGVALSNLSVAAVLPANYGFRGIIHTIRARLDVAESDATAINFYVVDGSQSDLLATPDDLDIFVSEPAQALAPHATTASINKNYADIGGAIFVVPTKDDLVVGGQVTSGGGAWRLHIVVTGVQFLP